MFEMAELRGAHAAVGRRGGERGWPVPQWDHRDFDAIGPLRDCWRPGSGAFRQNWTQVLSLMPRSASVRRAPG
jgi:hypothetical protein